MHNACAGAEFICRNPQIIFKMYVKMCAQRRILNIISFSIDKSTKK